MDETYFWPSVVYSIRTTMPLVEVLRLVDGEKTPAMGFIYGAMDECKEKIAKNFNGDRSSYKEIWEIIDNKWDFQMHRDLHAAAYYLNPQYRWSPNVSEHAEIKRGLYGVLDRLVKDTNIYMKIEDQLIEYKEKQGLFGYKGSLLSYKTRPPVQWWDQYGDDTPELEAFALKVIGLTCSASACERNWSTFNQVHTKRRNRLGTKKMNDLVYIMYNRKLKQKFMKKKNEEEDPLFIENVMSDDEWLIGESSETHAEEDEGEDNIVGADGSSGAIREEVGCSSSRKRKAVQLNLIDEDDEDDEDDDEVNLNVGDHDDPNDVDDYPYVF
ncbi:uncharacterized protein [Rutidosis leptorrhynchoides]|uniref:uncharacterized protein n=1 Tax=Rutidosis leptorrhynchoides TaxID=125765 RepID=UPI003A9A2F47